MAVTHPNLAKLFHPTKNGYHSPENLKAGTGIKLWWICNKGHEWQRDGYSMKNLTSADKCPHCRKANSMSVTHPELAKLFHPIKNGDYSPNKLKAGTGIKLWWICDKGHEWLSTGNNMTSAARKNFCPKCPKESKLK